MKKFLLVSVALFALILIGPKTADAVNYTLQDVQAHNTAANCWTIVGNNVYNLSGYIALHPGGSAAIIALCGTNATSAFTAMHGSSSAAQNALSTLLIGNLVVPDSIIPSAPTNLSATAVSYNQINLSWTVSIDNIGVIGYKIFRDGSQIGTSTSNSFSNTGLTASTTYSFIVSAFDAAGNAAALLIDPPTAYPEWHAIEGRRNPGILGAVAAEVRRGHPASGGSPARHGATGAVSSPGSASRPHANGGFPTIST